MPRDHEAVAAVVPLAATDQHAAVNAERDEQLRGPASGVLHQHDAGHAEFFDGPAINGADLFAAKKAHGN